MKHIVLLLVFFYLLPPAQGQPAGYWQQQVSYRIDVSLNDAAHTLDGFIKIKYTNHSPDTLSFIWFHLWPNAYKNDRTALSEQLLQHGETNFYFSDREQKGYINRLDFRVNGREAKMEDHPLYIDICKVVLPQPVAPGEQIEITTPFHEKLPYNFCGFGYIGQSYQLTHWYPKPAVYDKQGWHEMPFLTQGGSYDEPADFNVRITLPENYIVATTGTLMDDIKGEVPMSNIQNSKPKKQVVNRGDGNWKRKTVVADIIPSSSTQNTTHVFSQTNATGFAWYADKNFSVANDTLQLPSGKSIRLHSYRFIAENNSAADDITGLKKILRFYSGLLGDYPYPDFSIVESKQEQETGLLNPGLITIAENEKHRSSAIVYAAGLQWFGALISTDSRHNPWMAKGVADYYKRRYLETTAEGNYSNRQNKNGERHLHAATPGWFDGKMPDDRDKLFLDVLTSEKLDQPVHTPASAFSVANYRWIAGTKTALWLKQLSGSMGPEQFDNGMRGYFNTWIFKHPDRAAFSVAMEQPASAKTNQAFSLLGETGPLPNLYPHKKTRPAFLFSQKNTDRFRYINFGPAAGYNNYDKFMIGAFIHNINLPPDKFQFIFVPLYATNSRQLNGIGSVGYSWFPDKHFKKIELGISGARFSSLSGTDSNFNKIFGGFYKIVPSLRFTFRNNDAGSTMEKWLDLKTFLIGEKAFDYVKKVADSSYYPVQQRYSTRYLNQVTFNIDDYRVLYPYDVQLQLQQASNFYRVNFTTNYFFNYSKGGGMAVRLFAAKFGYIGTRSTASDFATEVYQPKLTASRGDEDYTYSNYFIGRNESTGFLGQQIMMKDGGLKLRTDLFQDLQGRSDNWIAAINFNTTLPTQIIPAKIPLKIFADIGTYAGGWSSNPPTSRFLYVGGLQLSLFKNILNIYAPLIYSSDFSSSLKSVPGENTFWRKVSFSIDIQNINFRKMFRNTPF